MRCRHAAAQTRAANAAALPDLALSTATAAGARRLGVPLRHGWDEAPGLWPVDAVGRRRVFPAVVQVDATLAVCGDVTSAFVFYNFATLTENTGSKLSASRCHDSPSSLDAKIFPVFVPK